MGAVRNLVHGQGLDLAFGPLQNRWSPVLQGRIGPLAGTSAHHLRIHLGATENAAAI
jgi:hypothetical protein